MLVLLLMLLFLPGISCFFSAAQKSLLVLVVLRVITFILRSFIGTVTVIAFPKKKKKCRWGPGKSIKYKPGAVKTTNSN